MLHILENVEHPLDAGGLFVELLQRAPGIKLLVTSREQLYLREESTYEVKGLAVPASPAEEIEQFDAVMLFLERACRAYSGFRLTEGDRASVVRLCQLLDGARSRSLWSPARLVS